jgi:hypothetical protein
MKGKIVINASPIILLHKADLEFLLPGPPELDGLGYSFSAVSVARHRQAQGIWHRWGLYS